MIINKITRIEREKIETQYNIVLSVIFIKSSINLDISYKITLHWKQTCMLFEPDIWINSMKKESKKKPKINL